MTQAAIDEGLPSWDSVAAQIVAITKSSAEEIDAATLSNALALVEGCRLRCAPPSGVSRGYFPTISFLWEGVEVEVFPTTLELYISHDGTMAISEFQFVAVDVLPDALLSQLPPRPTKKSGELD